MATLDQRQILAEQAAKAHGEMEGVLTGRLLKEPTARRYLGGMSHATLWELRQSGVIPTLRVGKSIYFDRADLDRFIEAIREGTANAAP